MSRITNAIKEDAKKYLNTEQIIEEAQNIQNLGSRALFAKRPLTRSDFDRPANYAAFREAQEKHGASDTDLHDCYLTFALMSYIGAVGIAVTMGMIITGTVFTAITGIGALAVLGALWFRGSYWAYLVKHQHLDGFWEWASTPSEWLPAPLLGRKS